LLGFNRPVPKIVADYTLIEFIVDPRIAKTKMLVEGIVFAPDDEMVLELLAVGLLDTNGRRISHKKKNSRKELFVLVGAVVAVLIDIKCCQPSFMKRRKENGAKRRDIEGESSQRARDSRKGIHI
jgi:hypothetical protein